MLGANILQVMVFDVTEAEFETRVVERSRELPVVVDMWAEWCGPCRALTPALERAATAREGDVELAKVDIDANQGLAARFGVQGIPAVKAFRDGRVVDEFTGALPAPQVEAFFDRLVPSEADRLATAGDEQSLRRALEIDPAQVEAGRELGRLLLRRGDRDEALEVLVPFEHDYTASGLAARARLELADGPQLHPHATDAEEPAREEDRLEGAFRAWDEGEPGRALDWLQEEVALAGGDRRDLLRRVMVAIFTELGPDDPLARDHRRRLATTLS